MTELAEIEAAIERLAPPDVDELAKWLDQHRARNGKQPEVDAWLQHARGAATKGITTDQILAETRGDG